MAKQCIKKITVTMETYVQFIPLISTDVYYHIDPPRHNFENCLLPCFVPESCFGRPLAAWPTQVAVRDKTR